MKKNLQALTLALVLATAISVVTASESAPASSKATGTASRQELLARGQQIAGAVCVACHGLDGVSPIPANPNIGGMPAEYIAKQLAAFKSGVRVNPTMQGMSANLSTADMQAIGTYYFSQRGKTQAVARDKALAERGQTIYRVGIPASNVPACASCHGASGAGLPTQYSKLAGQWPDYTLNELKAFASGERKNTQMNAIASRMKNSDMLAVAEYAAGMRGQP